MMKLQRSRYHRLSRHTGPQNLETEFGAETFTQKPVTSSMRRGWESFVQNPLPGARQHETETSTPNQISLKTPTTTLNYLSRRFLSPSSGAEVLAVHTVVEGDRLDLLAFHYYGDPYLYWLICDANGAMFPENLLLPGNRLVIPLWEEI